MKHQDWQRESGDESLRADSDDAPLSVQALLHERQHPRTTPLRRFANMFGVLAVFAFSFYLLAEYNGFGDLLKAKTNGLLNPTAPPIALPSIDLDRPTPRQTADPYRIPQHFEPIEPAPLSNAPISTPQPLADCIETANLIDEKVVACRYGALPRDHRSAPSGMVSAQYLAQYKADQTNRSSAPAKRSVSREVDQAWIERWDGGGSYLAEWHSLNNRRGSIDYRECRRRPRCIFVSNAGTGKALGAGSSRVE